MREPASDALRCPDCGGLCSTDWLDQASWEGREHACISEADRVARTVVTNGLTRATDDQLSAECERRGISLFSEKVAEICAQRDEWKRRAEAAEAKLESGEAVVREVEIGGRRVVFTASGVYRESGPGIAAMPRPCVDNEQWGCTLEDLVAGDA